MGLSVDVALPSWRVGGVVGHSYEILPREAEAMAFLLPLSMDYPLIESWYRQKVIPGLRAGTRLLIVVERNSSIVGLGIAKREQGERKICTVRVAPLYNGRGIGLRIFDRLLHWLDTDQPYLTVNEEKFPAFERIFENYGFTRTSVKSGLYVPNKSEFIFNEYR